MLKEKWFGRAENGSLKNNKTTIQKYYTGKNLFITGASGFLGKVLVERLFCTCSDVGDIYILLRPKKGLSVENRLIQLLDNPIFSKFSPEWRKKIIAIEGQVEQTDMGISEEHRLLLINKVDIVFHSAATVRFDEDLKRAIEINLLGSKHVIDLCKKIKKLEAFVHVSTAYSNIHHEKHIEEKFYESNPEQILTLYKLPIGVLSIFTQKILDNCPNTYILTKSNAETLVKDGMKGLPLAIYRPAAIIHSSNKHTYPGYIDNFYGPIGLMIFGGVGLLRSLSFNYKAKINPIPVDHCANAMIAIAWDLSVNKYDEPPVYNHSPEDEHNKSWTFLLDILNGSFESIPMPYSFWFPYIYGSSNLWIYNVIMIFTQVIPCYIFDKFLKFSGEKPMLMRFQRKIFHTQSVLHFFRRNVISFKLEAVARLRSRMSRDDVDLFYTEVKDIDWPQYVLSALNGARTFLLKASPAGIPKEQKKIRKFKIAHRVVEGLILMLAAYVFLLVLHRLCKVLHL